MTSGEELSKILRECNVSETNQKIVLEYLDTFRDVGRGLSEATVQNNTAIMVHVAKNIETDLDKLTKADVKAYKRAIQNWMRKDGKPISNATKKQYLRGFKQFIKWATDEFENPVYKELLDDVKIKLKGKEKDSSDMLTEDEIDRLIRAARDPRDIAMISVLNESGCRVGELISSKIKHVRFTSDFVWLTFPRGKTGSRTVPLKESIVYLQNWLSVHPRQSDENAPLFVSTNIMSATRGGEAKNYQPMNADSVLHTIRRLAKRAGITKRIYTHLFRHTCATRLAKVWTEPRLRNYLGWTADSSMPAVYCHLGASDLEDAARELYGMEEQKKSEPKFQKCPRCKKELPRRAEYCTVCGTALNQETQQIDEATIATMREIILKDHPEILEKVALAIMQAQKQ